VTRALVIVIVALAALGVLGCRRTSARVGMRPIPVVYRRVATVAASDMHCANLDAIVDVVPGVVQVRGCGQRVEYVIGSGRQPPRTIGSIAARASADLDCPAEHLVIASPAPAVRGVRGCDRRARYDLRCDDHCAWRMTAHAGAWRDLLAPGASMPTGWATGEPALMSLDAVVLPPAPAASSEGTPPTGAP